MGSLLCQQPFAPTRRRLGGPSRKIQILLKKKIGTRLALVFAVLLLLLISALAAGGISRAKRLTERSAALYGEVRGLSHLTSMAAREIRGLISASVQGVERGSTLMGQAGERGANTVHHVNQAVSLITAIKVAGQEQARGIARIGEAVRELDAATQQNAALVDDNSSASTGMRNQVKRLLEVIHQFRLAPDMPLSAGDAPLLAASGMPAAAALEGRGGNRAQLAISAR